MKPLILKEIRYFISDFHYFVAFFFMMLFPSFAEGQSIHMNIHQEGDILSIPTETIDSITFRSVAVNYDLEYQNLQISNPFPMGMHSLRVLILGNSFSYDTTFCLQSMLDASSVPLSEIGIYNYSIPSASFQTWNDVYEDNKEITHTNVIGKKAMLSSGSLKDILRQSWDLIVILNSSSLSYDWSSFEEALPRLLNIVRTNCLNDHVKVAYLLPWGHTKATTPKELAGNIQCAKRMMKEFDVDLIIPVGTAIENARNSSLQNEYNLTRDNWHLCYGIGRYIAACTFFESVITPVFHISCFGNNGIRPLNEDELNFNGTVPVTPENIRQCQECAILSTYYKMNVVTSY